MIFFSASLDAGCWDGDGEVCSVGGGAFGEHSARKDVRCFVAEEEAFGEQPCHSARKYVRCFVVEEEAFGEQPCHSVRKDVRCFVAKEEED